MKTANNTITTTTPHYTFTGQIVYNNNDFERTEMQGIAIGKQRLLPEHRQNILDNFRWFVQQDTEQIPKLNTEVLKYNAKVYAFIEQFDLHAEAARAKKDLDRQINSRKIKVSIKEYNEAAKLVNTTTGKLLIPMRKHVKVQLQMEATFRQILFQYAIQMDEQNAIREGIPTTTTRGLQKVKVNLYKLANNTTREGLKTLNVDTRTVQNHVKRFVERGILIDYEFKGYHYHKEASKRDGKPSEYYVNSEIFQVFDEKTQKIMSAENQLFSLRGRKTFTNIYSVDTRAFINKNKINRKVVDNQQPSISKGTLIQSPSGDNRSNYGSTQMRKQNKQDEGKLGRENLTTLAPVTAFLDPFLDDKHLLMQKLADGQYQNFKLFARSKEDISVYALEMEVYRGNMDPEDYFELLQQLAIKAASPIFKKLHQNNLAPYAGSYRGAYNEIYHLLINPNGTLPTKKVAFYRFKGVLWCIKKAISLLRNKEYRYQLQPHQYFDPTRTAKTSKGFGYMIEVYKNHKSYQQHKLEKEKRQRAEAQRHGYKAVEKVKAKAKQVVNGKLTVSQYQDYILSNKSIPNAIKQNAVLYLQQQYQV